MRTSRCFLSFLSLTWLFLGGCRPESAPEPPAYVEGSLTVTVTMPDPLEIEEVRTSLAYYWQEDLLLSGTLRQGDRSVPIQGLRPKTSSSDGSFATFELPLPAGTRLLLGEPIAFSGTVTRRDADPGAAIVSSENLGGTLPFDLLAAVPRPLIVEGGFNYGTGGDRVTLPAKPTGRLLFARLQNGTPDPLTPLSLTLTSSLPVFPSPESGESGGPAATVTLDFPTGEPALEGTFSKNYLVWLPDAPEDLGSVRARLRYQKSPEGAAATADLPEPVALPRESQPLRLAILAGPEEEPAPEEADDRNGGDPHFAMSDIDFWVGEGSKTAALVLEWHLTEGEDAYVWGYRFDGDKTGYDMLLDVVRADPRLSVLLRPGNEASGPVIGAIAYQTGHPDSPKPPFLLDGTPAPNDGKGVTTAADTHDFGRYTFGDAEALYRFGFHSDTPGYWSYWTKNGRLQAWNHAATGLADRHLQDGSWDAWSYQEGWESVTGEQPGPVFRPARAE